MEVFAAVARTGKPLLSHSGILWDHKASGRYCRPVNFEPLLGIPDLRFALAHMSWPWTDECIAVFGKFLAACRHRPELSAEMFIDITPGTPPIYRSEALTRLCTVGYHVEHNVQFGTDCNANAYRGEWARDWIDRDNTIYDELGLSAEMRDNIYSGNLLRFLGLSEAQIEHRRPSPDGS
jgi:predicted TIM-barrel fold metal-dependent hydrolase